MLVNQIIILITGAAVAILGALPFGLVNLTVLDISMKRGNRYALSIAHGAALVEVFYGLIAIFAGSLVKNYIDGNVIINYFIILVLVVAGLFFLVKKQKSNSSGETGYLGFLKGAFLNLISIQVFLFWLIALAYLSSKQLIQYDILSVLVFLAGIWIGKMTVLLLYMLLSKKIVSHSQILSKNINRIIGFILFGVAVFQTINM
ncbi:MAG: LysE family transporter [Bacteroidales bacterium]|nr:LysE family transporter [Bacteroidales bacterium]